MAPVTRRRVTWALAILGIGGLHLAMNRVLGTGSPAQLAVTDLTVTALALGTFVAALGTARRCAAPNVRAGWRALAAGVGLWSLGAIGWDIRELGLGVVAPATSWADAPFFALAPAFAVALAQFRRGEPSRALQLKQVADLGIVVAAMAIVGIVLFAGPLARHGGPMAALALGYPCVYLSLVVVALGALGQHAWKRRQVVLGVLVWSQLAFASVDLLYGAGSLGGEFQTTGLEDTLWIVGMLALCWAGDEERALRDAAADDAHAAEPRGWHSLVAAVAVLALVGFLVDAAGALRGWSWLVLAVAAVAALGFVALRMWAAEQLDDAFRGAIADGEAKSQALARARTDSNRWRALGTVAGGTAHEVNNLLQAIAGNLELLKRRAARGEDLARYLSSIDRALWQASDEVKQLRQLAHADVGPRGTVLLMQAVDLDGRASAALGDAGFAAAALPDLDALLRATKGVEVRAIVVAPGEALAVIHALAARGLQVPVVAASRPDGVAIDVAGILAAIEATDGGAAAANGPRA
jgi:signal transduction histidine kinase